MTDRPRISVIIPVYNDADGAVACLQALGAQTYDADQFEVIVVDNGSAVEEREKLERFRGSNVAIIEEREPGSYAARNRGIEHAGGEILAFVDSGCSPKSDWLEAGSNALAAGYDRVAGHVEITVLPGKSSILARYDQIFSFDQESNAAAGRSVTANMLVWRHCIDTIGKFTNELYSGGDFEWSDRATRAGLSIIYVRQCCVEHPARRGLHEQLRKKRRIHGPRAYKGASRGRKSLFQRYGEKARRFSKKMTAQSEMGFAERIIIGAVAVVLFGYGLVWRVGTRLRLTSASRV